MKIQDSNMSAEFINGKLQISINLSVELASPPQAPVPVIPEPVTGAPPAIQAGEYWDQNGYRIFRLTDNKTRINKITGKSDSWQHYYVDRPATDLSGKFVMVSPGFSGSLSVIYVDGDVVSAPVDIYGLGSGGPQSLTSVYHWSRTLPGVAYLTSADHKLWRLDLVSVNGTVQGAWTVVADLAYLVSDLPAGVFKIQSVVNGDVILDYGISKLTWLNAFVSMNPISVVSVLPYEFATQMARVVSEDSLRFVGIGAVSSNGKWVILQVSSANKTFGFVVPTEVYKSGRVQGALNSITGKFSINHGTTGDITNTRVAGEELGMFEGLLSNGNPNWVYGLLKTDLSGVGNPADNLRMPYSIVFTWNTSDGITGAHLASRGDKMLLSLYREVASTPSDRDFVDAISLIDSNGYVEFVVNGNPGPPTNVTKTRSSTYKTICKHYSRPDLAGTVMPDVNSYQASPRATMTDVNSPIDGFVFTSTFGDATNRTDVFYAKRIK